MTSSFAAETRSYTRRTTWAWVFVPFFGHARLEQIRATLGDQAPTVAIALTAYAGERDRQRSAAAGYRQHLAKPFDPLALVDVIAGMLSAA